MSEDPAATGSALATILVVEPDPLVRELLTAALALHQSAWRVESAASAVEASALVRAETSLDLLVLEPALPDPAAGAALVRQVRRWSIRVPILLVTAAPQEAWRRGLDVDAMLDKPIDADQLLPRVERLLAAHSGSVVRGIGLATLLQMIEVEKKDCTLSVRSEGRSGRLWVRDGRLARAETRSFNLRRGRDAFFAMLDWPSPVIEVVDRCDLPDPGVEGLQGLLLQHAIAKDHGVRF
jgi:DNA-binding response OmpR family regulator